MNITTLLFLTLALFSNFICIFLIALRYKHLFISISEHAKFLDVTKLVAITQIASYLTPFNIGILLGRPFIGKKFFNIQPGKTILATVIDQWLEFFWQSLLVIFLIVIGVGSFFQKDLFVFPILFLILSLVFLLLFSKTLYPKIFIIKDSIPSFLKKLLKRFITLQDLTTAKTYLDQNLHTKKFILPYFSLVLLFILAYPLILYFTSLAFSSSLPYTKIFTATWASYLIGRLSGIPGGFGTRDLTLGAFLALYGLSLEQAAIIALVYRIVTLLPSFLLSLSFVPEILFLLKKNPPKSI